VDDKLTISKKRYKGDDSHQTFSVRLRAETVFNLEQIAKETNRSRNEVINLLLDWAVENCEIL